MKQLIATVARNPVLPNLLMAIILITGFFYYVQLRREAMPEIKKDIIEVKMVYPGASASEIEEAIVIKTENELNGLDGLNYIDGIARENIGIIYVYLKDGVSDKQKILQDVKDRVNRIPDFPKDVEKPIVQILQTKSNAMILVLNGNAPERTLRELAFDIKDELLSCGISQIQLGGVRDYEISIEVQRKMLRAYDLTMSDIAKVVQQGSMNLASGSIKTMAEEYKIEVKGRKYRATDYRDLLVKVRPDGTAIRLSQIAEIRESFEEGQCLGRFEGKNAVQLTIKRTGDEDIIQIAKTVRTYVHEKQSDIPEGVDLTIFADFSDDVTKRIDILVTNAWQGLILLFFTLWIFLNIKLAFWVTVGIPISFAFTGMIMGFCGETLNSVTLFGLILVLGIVVDDAIVISENVHLHQKNNDSMQGAIDGASEMAMPVIGAVLTTVLAFLPLFFVKGIMGKFIAIMPLVVIATLIGSLFEGLFILPAHLGHGGHRSDHNNNAFTQWSQKLRGMIESVIDYFVLRFYVPVYHIALEFRYATVAMIIFCLLATIGLISGGLINFVLFPDSDTIFLVSNVEFPEGTTFSITREAIERLENAANVVNKKYGDQGKDGTIILGIYSETGEKGGGSNKGFVRLTLVPPEDRDIHSLDIMNYWRKETGTIYNALKVSYNSEGGLAMPVKDMEIFLTGKNFNTLTAATIDMQNKLQDYQGAYDIESDYKPGKRELNIHLKQQGMIMGITLHTLASQLRQGFFGTEVLKIQRGRDSIDVEVKYAKDERANLGDLFKTRIRTPSGHEVPFETIASVTMKRGMSEIKRRDRKRRIRITCTVDKTITTPIKLQHEISKNDLPDLAKQYPDVQIFFKGSNDEQNQSLNSLANGYIFAMVGIYMVLAIIFRSYMQPLLIMAAIPFGIIGAVFGHYIIGFPLSMLSVFGIVALSGVVVNDSLVMIERINEGVRNNMSILESVQDAGPRRFRAIIITSMTTIAGLLPLLAEKSLQAQSLKPMAISLAAGLIFATFLTLFIIPCLYLMLNDTRRLTYWIKTGDWPSREFVESRH